MSVPRKRAAMNASNWYWIGYWISWVLIFVGCWIYCVAEYGFLLGVGLGWLPSLIVALVASFFWPLLLLGVVWIIILLTRH
jgi:hypothetical protein